MDASVLAVGRQIFAGVTIRTWQQPENAHKKSLAPRLRMPLIITPFIEHELFYFGFNTGSVTFSVVGWEHRRSKTLIDRQMLWEGSTNRLWQTTTCVSMATFNRRYYPLKFWLLVSSWEIRRLIPFCPCFWHTLRLGRLCCSRTFLAFWVLVTV